MVLECIFPQEPVAGSLLLETERLSVGIEEELWLRVIGVDEFGVSCKPKKLVGRRLIVRLSAPVSLDACVEIESDGALLLGEVLGCWREASSIFAAIELQQALTGLADLRSRFDYTSRSHSAVQKATSRMTG
jgi:hypothetical protein